MLRSKGDAIVLEGPHLVDEALRAGLDLETVLVEPTLAEQPAGRELIARLRRPPLAVAAEVLASLADADSPQGILAIARLWRGGVEALPLAAGGVYVYAEELQDPGNLGALARSLEAAGGAGLALGPGSAHPSHRRALRASAGSLLRLPVGIEVTAEALQARLAPLHPTWVALLPHEGEDLYRCDLAGAIVLLLGAEGPGLSPALLRRADRRLTIPLAGPVESLNATVAAALALFELRRRREL